MEEFDPLWIESSSTLFFVKGGIGGHVRRGRTRTDEFGMSFNHAVVESGSAR
jgi:hypothetical protein